MHLWQAGWEGNADICVGAESSPRFEGISQGFKERTTNCVNNSDEWKAQFVGWAPAGLGVTCCGPTLTGMG